MQNLDLETIELIKARANLLKGIRAFFEAEGVIEVDTPLLYPAATTDPYIQHLSLDIRGKLHYLQSSPEFAMKRLLSQAPVSMYQLCKAFRNDGEGSKHKTEFTMLEWYMLNWTLEQLIEQCTRLFSFLLQNRKIERITYLQAFQKVLAINPFSITEEQLRDIVKRTTTAVNVDRFSKDECLHLLFVEKVEKSFDSEKITFIENFPASQAALAQCAKDSTGNKIAKRFEIYCKGIELANAYQEERDASILLARFEKENKQRKETGLPEVLIDKELLKAMENFPSCSGIAMGVDRLLMILLNKSSIQSLDMF